ncbi:MAG: hypothetical protein QF752_02875 [Planctomycetota bacterium]|nr:hypothetical protein [Planctomycetota bacterium]
MNRGIERQHILGSTLLLGTALLIGLLLWTEPSGSTESTAHSVETRDSTPSLALSAQKPTPTISSNTPTRTSKTATSSHSSRLSLHLLEHGEPLAGLQVRLTEGARIHEDVTDARGRLYLDITPGTYQVEIPERNIVTAVEVATTRTSNIQLEVPGTQSLRGRVLDLESQAPLENAWIEVFPRETTTDEDNPAYQRMAWTQSDASGHFQIDGLPDRPVRIVVQRRSHDTHEQIIDPGTDQEIHMRSFGTVQLEIVDANGRPTILSPVTVEITDGDRMHVQHDLFCDENGRLYVTDLITGTYWFRVQINGVWSKRKSAYATPQKEVPTVLTVDTQVTLPETEIPHGPDDLQKPDDPDPGCQHDHGAEPESK